MIMTNEFPNLISNEIIEPRRYPKKIIISFQAGVMIRLMIANLMAVQSLYFFETVVGFDVGLYALANIIYAFFNAINDPILGYLSDRPHKFTKKYGKRFPLILLGGIPWCFMIILIFAFPKVEDIGQTAVFVWYIVLMVINDTCFALYKLNKDSLFPDKFRHVEDRNYAGLWITIFETMGVLFGFAIPILGVAMMGEDNGYFISAVLMSIVNIIVLAFSIPGMREDKELRERRAIIDTNEHDPFFKGMMNVFKNKSFIGFSALYILYYATMGTIMASIPYFVKDILIMEKMGEFIVVAYIVGVLITAPLWYKAIPKLGLKKVALFGGITLGLMGIPFMFVPSGIFGLIVTIIILFAAGLADGAIVSMYMPLLSSTIDHGTLMIGKRQEGLYNGVLAFISSFGAVITPIIVWLIRIISGYDPKSTNTPEQLLGLRAQMSIIPMLLMFTGLFIFYKFYPFTNKDIEENSRTLLERNL